MNTTACLVAALLVSPMAIGLSPVLAVQSAEIDPSPSARLAETRLRALLSAIEAGRQPPYADMTEDAAAGVRDAAASGGVVAAPGPFRTIEWLGSPPGAHLFRVVYPSGAYCWLIALDGEGRISALYFHPDHEDPSPH